MSDKTILKLMACSRLAHYNAFSVKYIANKLNRSQSYIYSKLKILCENGYCKLKYRGRYSIEKKGLDILK